MTSSSAFATSTHIHSADGTLSASIGSWGATDLLVWDEVSVSFTVDSSMDTVGNNASSDSGTQNTSIDVRGNTSAPSSGTSNVSINATNTSNSSSGVLNHNHSLPANTGDYGNSSPTALDNRPVHTGVVWLIRVN